MVCGPARSRRRQDRLDLAADTAAETAADHGVSLTPPVSDEEDEGEEGAMGDDEDCSWCGDNDDHGDSSFEQTPKKAKTEVAAE